MGPPHAPPIVLAAILPIALGLSQASDDSGITIAVNVVAWLVFVVDLVVHVRLVHGYLKTGVGVFDLAIVVVPAPVDSWRMCASRLPSPTASPHESDLGYMNDVRKRLS